MVLSHGHEPVLGNSDIQVVPGLHPRDFHCLIRKPTAVTHILCSSSHLPQYQQFIDPASHEPCIRIPISGYEGSGCDRVLVPCHIHQALPSLAAPDLGRGVIGSGDQILLVM